MRAGTRSFTLVELLVVMGIIGLLVALLFPAIGAARQAANRSRAESEVKSLEAAMLNFRRDYGLFPLQTTATDKDYTGTDYANLITVLRGSNLVDSGRPWNPRREIYLEVPASSLVNNEFRDPWDRPYRVMADWNNDNRLQLPSPLATVLEGRSVAVWSTGPDGTSTSNFITSWGR